MRRPRRSALTLLALACLAPAPEAAEVPARPNMHDLDGTPGFVHFAPEEMPLRITLGRPRSVAQDADVRALLDMTLEVLGEWEQALRATWPGFRFDPALAHDDPHIEIAWERRTDHQQPARARLHWEARGDELRLRSRISVSPVPVDIEHHLRLAELADHLRPAIGAALGLRSCHPCAAAMSRDWKHHARRTVHAHDALAFQALMRMPSGQRIDGLPLMSLGGQPAEAGFGVRAVLPFENVGDAKVLVVDLAGADEGPLLARLLTGFGGVAFARRIAPARPKPPALGFLPTRAGTPLEYEIWDDGLLGGPAAPAQRWVGESYLSGFVVDLDFDRGELRLLSPGAHAAGDALEPFVRERVVSLEKGNGRLRVPIRVGAHEDRALLATGAGFALYLPPGRELPERARLLLGDVDAGEVRVLRDPGELPSHLAVHASRPILGLDVLMRFRVRIDYPRGALGLSERSLY